MRIVTASTLVALFTLGCSSPASNPPADAHLSAVDTVASISKPQDTLPPLSTGGTCPNTVDYFSETACNTLENSAPAVPYTANPGTPPTFTGGTILDGKYHASKVEGFGPTPGTGRKVTIVIAQNATKFYWKGEVLDATKNTPFSAVMTATTEGNQLTQTKICSTGGVGLPPMNYTATPTAITLSIISGDTTFVTTYTRIGCP
jgi:hypothetical protein